MMSAAAILTFAAFVLYTVGVVRTINRRLDHDLPLLTDEGQKCIRRGFHEWTSEPGSAMDKCECGSYQLRRWTS